MIFSSTNFTLYLYEFFHTKPFESPPWIPNTSTQPTAMRPSSDLLGQRQCPPNHWLRHPQCASGPRAAHSFGCHTWTNSEKQRVNILNPKKEVDGSDDFPDFNWVILTELLTWKFPLGTSERWKLINSRCCLMGFCATQKGDWKITYPWLRKHRIEQYNLKRFVPSLSWRLHPAKPVGTRQDQRRNRYSPDKGTGFLDAKTPETWNLKGNYFC